MNNSEPIFLKLSSDNPEYDRVTKAYIFYGNEDKEYEDNIIYEINDPAIDSTFKYLFAQTNTKLLGDMLNSILFPDSPKLKNIEILNNEIVKPFQPHDKGTIRSDIACKAKLGSENIVIGIEMQLGIYGDFTRKLYRYNIGLATKNDYKTSWSIGFFIEASEDNNNSSLTELNKMENEINQKLPYLKIIEINLKEEIDKINNNEDIYINNRKIGDNGKEWIKLLGLRTWCAKQSNKFILPKTHKLSNNPNFYEAIKILSDIPVTIQIASLQFAVDLENYNKTLDDIKTKTIIDNSYKLFCLKCEKEYIFELLKEKKFKKEDIISALGKNVEKGLINEFILFLKNNNFLLN